MIETTRLILKPLTCEQLLKYIENDNSLELDLGLNQSVRTISAELKEALEQTIVPNVADVTKNYLFSTLWTVILKSENSMIGDLCFVGEPNEVGEVEIGYGTYEKFRQKGYMREAVAGMIQWADMQPTVKAIVAETERNNVASFTILEKNGFIKVAETETLLKWKLPLK